MFHGQRPWKEGSVDDMANVNTVVVHETFEVRSRHRSSMGGDSKRLEYTRDSCGR